MTTTEHTNGVDLVVDTAVAFLMAQLEQAQRKLNRLRYPADGLSADELHTLLETARNERDELSRRRDVEVMGARAELAEFKTQVVDIASRYAKRHDWCSVVDKALEELGLEWTAPKAYTATLEITVEFNATLKSGVETNLPTDWVEGSLLGKSAIEEAIRQHLRGDSDHEGLEVNDISFDVTEASFDDE